MIVLSKHINEDNRTADNYYQNDPDYENSTDYFAKKWIPFLKKLYGNIAIDVLYGKNKHVAAKTIDLIFNISYIKKIDLKIIIYT